MSMGCDHDTLLGALMETPNDEFEQVIREHINWASEWDGVLPADVFFGAWADLQHERTRRWTRVGDPF